MKGNCYLLGALFTFLSMTTNAKASTPLILTYPETSIETPIPAEISGIPTSKEYLAGLLDKFCQEYYYKCFKGREYAEGSTSIEKVEVLNEWEVAVEGRHTYLGRLGHEYRKRPFRAVILLHKGTEDTFTITYEKQSENQLMNTTYWEDTTQIFRYKH
jgi:hypothetical protein